MAAVLLIPDKTLPANVLCVGIKTPTQTIIKHKEDAKR